MKKFLMLAAALAVFTMRATPALHAQTTDSEADCAGCNHNLDTDEHWFRGTLGYYDCVAFNSCHTNPQHPFACSFYHWDCGATGAFLDVDKAKRAADPGRALVLLAKMNPKSVHLMNGYVVVTNCKGAIVAAYRAPGGDPKVMVTAASNRGPKVVLHRPLTAEA